LNKEDQNCEMNYFIFVGVQVLSEGSEDGFGPVGLGGGRHHSLGQASQLPAERDQPPQSLILEIDNLNNKRSNWKNQLN
jgi:hypothetical protein